ncbi:hypothetical protein P7C73_g5695, partial [Tremellales sp. Uapishka_1]
MSNTTVIYKPNEHADEYIVFVEDEAEYKQWKDQPTGSKDLALARFVGQFAIYKSGTGHTGQLGEISKQELENVFFGDDKSIKDKSVEAAIVIILQNGRIHKGDTLGGNKIVKNPARGAGDVRGTGAHQGSHR